jgi:hypothetical protein
MEDGQTVQINGDKHYRDNLAMLKIPWKKVILPFAVQHQDGNRLTI